MDILTFTWLDGFLQGFPILKEYDLLERFVIVLIYAVFAIIFDMLIIRALRSVAGRTKMHFDDFLINFFHRPFLITVLLIGVLHACSVEPSLPHLYAYIIPGLSQSSIIIVWAAAFLRSLSRTNLEEGRRILGGVQIDADIFSLFKNVSRIVILFSAIFWILLVWDVNLSPLFASAGIVGIAIALAAKDTLANFFGGIF